MATNMDIERSLDEVMSCTDPSFPDCFYAVFLEDASLVLESSLLLVVGHYFSEVSVHVSVALVVDWVVAMNFPTLQYY